MEEEELYQEMKQLCVKRRLLHCLLKHGPAAHIKRLNEYMGKYSIMIAPVSNKR